jgi:hypothetical protein
MLFAHVGDRSIDQALQACEAAFQYRAGGAADGQTSLLEGGNGKNRRREVVAQLVSQEPGPLMFRGVLPTRYGDVALFTELRHRIGDRVVQAAIQRSKLGDRKGCVAIECQLGDRLTQVAVIVDHLVDGKAQFKELLAMGRSADSHLGQRQRIAARSARYLQALAAFVRFFGLQRSAQLLEEQRHAVLQLLLSGLSVRPLSDLRLASRDQFVAIVGQERVHHVRISGVDSIGDTPPSYRGVCARRIPTKSRSPVVKLR